MQLLLYQTCDPPGILLIREGVTQGDPLLMVLYGITPEPLAEELRYADPTLLLPFYSNDLVFNGSARRSASQLHLLMDRGAGPGLLPQYRQVAIYIRQPGGGGVGKAGIRVDRLTYKLRRLKTIPGGILEAQGGARGLGAARV